jgi:hypothetical protein
VNSCLLAHTEFQVTSFPRSKLCKASAIGKPKPLPHTFKMHRFVRTALLIVHSAISLILASENVTLPSTVEAGKPSNVHIPADPSFNRTSFFLSIVGLGNNGPNCYLSNTGNLTLDLSTSDFTFEIPPQSEKVEPFTKSSCSGGSKTPCHILLVSCPRKTTATRLTSRGLRHNGLNMS